MGNEFMARAIQLSLDNVRSGHGGPFGAVIVKDCEIVAEGANRVTAAKDATAHAEMVAIREACRKLNAFDLKGCEIFCSCEPCPMCLGAIYWARLTKVFYANLAADAARIGFDDSKIYEEFGKAPAQRTIPMTQIMHDEGQAAFREWARSSSRLPY